MRTAIILTSMPALYAACPLSQHFLSSKRSMWQNVQSRQLLPYVSRGCRSACSSSAKSHRRESTCSAAEVIDGADGSSLAMQALQEIQSVFQALDESQRHSTAARDPFDELASVIFENCAGNIVLYGVGR